MPNLTVSASLMIGCKIRKFLAIKTNKQKTPVVRLGLGVSLANICKAVNCTTLSRTLPFCGICSSWKQLQFHLITKIAIFSRGQCYDLKQYF
jgi:hypothetical protein